MVLLRGLAAILVACVMAPPVLAGELPPPPGAAPEHAQVFVQIVLNGRVTDALVPLETDDGTLAVARSDLRAAGMVIEGDGAVVLSNRSDIAARYDALEQRLYLHAAPQLLPQSRLRGPARERVHAQASTGAAFNYNLYVQRTGRMGTASLFSQQRVFGSFGAVSNSGVLRRRLGGGDVRLGFPNGYLRYDTHYRFVDQDRALAVTAGDLITASLPWSTSVRMGGLQVGRNFAARPDLVTTPLPSFAGEAAVPSAVDVFIDGYRQARTSVQPGRFVLDNMPVVNGAGQATIVTTDAVGRQVATTIPFYVSASLLRPGLTDFSAEAGALRRGYGVRSFGYGAAAVSFVVRHGLSAQLTASAHGEARSGLAAGGVGVDWSPGLWGALHATASGSRAEGRTGSQLTLGYDYAGRRFTLAAEHRRTSRNFRDLGGFDLRTLGRATSTRMVLGAQLGRLGSIGVGYIDARTRGAARARLLSASWSLPVSGRISAFAGVDYDLQRRSGSGQVRVVVPFGRASVSAGISHNPARGLRSDAEFDLAVPSHGGWGLSAGAALDERGSGYGQATAQLRTSTARYEASASVAAGSSALGAGVSGSIVALDGGLFAANDAPGSFAVVDTGDVPNVPVTYENQPIGKTDAKGRLFIRDVTAYHAGRIAIDPLALDVGLATSKVEARFAVAEGAGAVLHMPIRRTRSATLKLVDALGRALPAGSTAALPGGQTMPVGWDGLVYFADLGAEPFTLEVRRTDGGTCRAHVAPPSTAPALADLGAVPCT